MNENVSNRSLELNKYLLLNRSLIKKGVERSFKNETSVFNKNKLITSSLILPTLRNNSKEKETK
jgi:hypothetical protein